MTVPPLHRISADIPLRDWELALWGTKKKDGVYFLSARGVQVGYVSVKERAGHYCEIMIQCFADESGGWAAVEKRTNPELDATIVAAVRKCLFGTEGWPKHEVELSYRTYYSVY